MLIRSRAWNEVGPFDESYFLYAEDADWCLRARERRWRVAVAPSSGPEERVTHAVSSSIARTNLGDAGRVRYVARNSVRLIRKHYGRWLPMVTGQW